MLHVVAATIVNQQNQVLVTRRAKEVHQGGKWEFPGGKVERGEAPIEALKRELAEELGIGILKCEPLIKTHYHYPEHRVLLEVWQVSRFQGVPKGREGQPLRWVTIGELQGVDLPEANLPVLTALKLPNTYLITPEPGDDWPLFLSLLTRVIRGRRCLIRFRAKSLTPETYFQRASCVVKLCHKEGAYVLIDGRPEWVERLSADGLHMHSVSLMATPRRPIPPNLLLGVSCHDTDEIEKANEIAADFAVISPVKVTQSHSGTSGMGWAAFARLCDRARMPTYALGGMHPEDLHEARSCGGQGIAAIRSLWPAYTRSGYKLGKPR